MFSKLIWKSWVQRIQRKCFGKGAKGRASASCRCWRIEALENRLVPAVGFDFPGQVAAEYAAGGVPQAVTLADINHDGAIDVITANSSGSTVSVLRNLGDGSFATEIRYPVGSNPTSVKAVDIDDDGLLDLITTNANTHNVSVLLNLGDGTFAPHVTYGVSSSPQSVTAADVNGDGNVDLMTANSQSAFVSVLLNLGDGTFAPRADYPMISSARSITAADVDADGAIDLITANYFSNNVSVLLNLGNGTFAPHVTYEVGQNPASVAAADLNNDGAVDLVTVNSSDNSVSILRNLGDGTFAEQVTHATREFPTSVAAVDIDGDGAIDLVTSNASTSVSVLRNLGDGGFEEHLDYQVGVSPNSVAVGDVDGDGAVDIVTANTHGNSVSVLHNLGNGRFTAPITHTEEVAGQPEAVATADVDGDGFVDLITADRLSHNVSVLLNLGDGNYAPYVSYATGNNPTSVTAADLDRDGALDLITANSFSGNVSILRNLGNGSFAEHVTYPVGGSPRSVTAADLDGDGAEDLVAANFESGTISVLRNLGDGTFDAQVTYGVGNGPASVTAVDVDNDGVLDLVVANSSSSTLSVLRNLGNGSFAAHVTYPVASGAFSVAAADVDGDGAFDLITANRFSFSVSVLRNAGDGTFMPQVLYPTSNGPYTVSTADVDRDGAVDLVVATFYGKSVDVLRNLGGGIFAAAVSYAADSSLTAATAADVDGDGAVDLIAANTNRTVSVMTNLGDGTFAARAAYTVGSSARSMTAADIDQNGTVDLITANAGSNTVSVLRNLGNGTYAAQVTYPVFFEPYAVTAADVDGDGAVDLITANFASGNVSVLRNTGTGTFDAAINLPAGTRPTGITAADFDGDGNVDIVAVSQDGTVSVLRNLGDLTFAPQVTYTVTIWSYFVLAADVDDDGAMDVIIENRNPEGTVSVLRNRGDGTFEAAVHYGVGSNPQFLTAADVDGDGELDLIAANGGSHTVSVLHNLGDGTFAAQVIYPVGTNPLSVTATDINQDGAPDLVAGNNGRKTVSILLNQGDGTFAAQLTYRVGGGPVSIIAADVNTDGAIDLAIADLGSVTILRNLAEGGAVVAPDLAVSAITATPNPAELGDTLQVQYTVTNSGPVTALGRWVDSLFLSRDDQFDASDYFLTRVTHQGDLLPGASYSQTLTLGLEAFAGFVPGGWHVLVRTDAGADAPEQSNTNNTGTASLTIEQPAITVLSVGETFIGTITAGQERYFRVDFAAGQEAAFALSGLPADGAIAMYVKRDGFPTRSVYDLASTRPFVTDQYVSFPTQLTPTTYYVLLHAPTLSIPTGSFQLTASVPTFGVRTTRFGTAGNAGDATIKAAGFHFNDTITVRLTSASGFELEAKGYLRQSASDLYATFDLRGVPPGAYNVLFSNGIDDTVTVANSLTVVAANTPDAVIPRVIAPAAIRRGREFTFTVEWTNDSLNDVVVPLLTVGSPVPFGLTHNDYSLGTAYMFLGINTQGGPAGILRPGQRETLTFWSYSDNEPGEYTVFVDRIGKNPSEPFDWEFARTAPIAPAWTQSEVDQIWEELVSSVGPNWSDFLQMVSRNVSRLPQPDDDWSEIFRQVIKVEFDRVAATQLTSLSGRIVSDESTLSASNVSVSLLNQTSGEQFNSRTLADGSFSFARIPPGTYRTTINDSVASGTATIDLEEGQHVYVEVPMYSASHLDLQITDTAGTQLNQWNAFIWRNGKVIAVAGDDGVTHTPFSRFNNSLIRAGDLLMIESLGYARLWLDASVVWTDSDTVQLSLTRESRVTGSIVNDAGQPINEGVMIADNSSGPLPYIAFVGTGSNAFTLVGLPAGEFTVTFSSSSGDLVWTSQVTVPEQGVVNLGQVTALPAPAAAPLTAGDGAVPITPSDARAFAAPSVATSTVPLVIRLALESYAVAIMGFVGGQITRGLEVVESFGLFDSYFNSGFEQLTTFESNSDLGYAVREHPDTRFRLDALRVEILRALERRSEWQQVFDCDAEQRVTYSLTDLDVDPAYYKVYSNLPHPNHDSWGYHTGMFNLITGGVSNAGTPPVTPMVPEFREVTGLVTVILRPNRSVANVIIDLDYTIFDAVDFWPDGNRLELFNVPWIGGNIGLLNPLAHMEINSLAHDQFWMITVPYLNLSSLRIDRDCDPCDGPNPPDSCSRILRPASRDPNDIIGPAGVGPLNHILDETAMPYTIRFENDAATATAPAAMVTITQTLDSDLDWTTFRLGDIGFGNTIVAAPADTAFFETRVDLTGTHGVFVDIDARLDVGTGLVTWEFVAIDPLTGDIPENPFVGFLPPNVNGPEGEGFVNYTVRQKSGVVTGDRIDAVASIVFDVNEAILTPAIFHTVDQGAPASQVQPLTDVTTATSFLVAWSGIDDAQGPAGAGIEGFNIYVSDNGGPFTLWLGNTTETSATFTGQLTHTYAFYSIARDGVEHLEAAPVVPDATTTLNPSPELNVGGPAVTWTKKQAPVAILPLITVANTNVSGGTLTLTLNVIAKRQKLFDQFITPTVGAIGSTSGPMLQNVQLVLHIELSPTATADAIQSFLRGVKFSTKGKGLKTPTRTLTITLERITGTSTISQTVRVLKKG